MHRCREIPRNCLDSVDRQDKNRQDTTVARKSLFQSMKTFLECNVLHFLEWMEDNKEILCKPQFCGLRRMMNTDYRESRCNIDCVNLNLVDRQNTTIKSFFRSTELFSRYSVHNFLEWMGFYEKVPRKARSTEWDILFMLYNVYKTQSIFTFELKVHPNISDHIMQNAIDSDDCTFVSDCMRKYLYDQGHFEDMMCISPRIVDIILQKVKNLMLKKLPNLTNNGIVLSLCWECGQGNRLVIVMSYKGKIEMANQIPNKVLGFKFVLYNFTKPSKEACDVFKPITVSKKTHLPTVTESEARELFRKHSNLTMISASRYKSMGYSKGKHGIVEKPCINLFCFHKGYIPYGEEQFPKHIGEFEVDVLEGYSVFGSGASLEIGGYISRAGCGSIGGFVDLPNNRTGLLTCAHVIFSSKELEELESMNGVPPGIEVKAFDKTTHAYRVCGTCTAAEFPKCFQQATSLYPNVDAASLYPNVDAALIELDPVINTFSLRAVSPDQLYSAGFDPNNPPAFTGEVVSLSEPDSFLRTHGRIPDKLDGVVKYGCETGLTIGNLYHSGSHVRFVNQNLELPGGSRSVLCDQIEIQNLPQGQFFEPGDSGSFVFCINPDKTLSCLGMAVGLSFPHKSCLVTPIDRILRSVCPPGARLKPCSSFTQQRNAPPQATLDMILSAKGNFQASFQSVQTNFQTSLQNVERNMESKFQASIQNVQTELCQVQQTEDSRIHNVETNVQAQIQKPDAYQGGHVSVMEELPKAVSDGNLQDSGGDTPLIAANERGLVSVMEELVKVATDGNLQEEVDNIGSQQECVGEDGLVFEDPMVMFLLLCPSYKVQSNDQKWIPKYNTFAKKFGFTTITKLTDLSQPEKYKPVVDFSESEITFSTDLWRDKSFLLAAESYEFVDIFLNLADKENIASYCRSPTYKKNQGEICYCLTANQIEKFVERLGEDIFTHSAIEDQSIRRIVFQKVGIPMQIFLRGDEIIQNFIQHLKRGKQKIYHASGMIIGCAGSGKTTLLKRLQDIPVEEIIKTTPPTRGVDVMTDVFDVTDTLQVNNSGIPHRFRMTIEKPDHSNEKTNDDLLPEDMNDIENNDQMLKDINVDRNESQEEDIISPQNLEPNDGDEVLRVHNTMNLESASLSHQYHEISSIIPVSQGLMSDDEIPLTRKISMTDFAGQCAYYASHQMFLSPRAFFLLVLNMKKKLDDVVDENVCCQKGSVYKEWTYGDYLEFWLKSVRQYSSDKAPVLLVATHCEKITEEERQMFFWNLRKNLSTKDKSLLEHLALGREFSVSFEDDAEIEKIKSCIVKTVENLDDWGQDLPQSWVLFETFLRDAKKKKIIKRNEVIDFNKALYKEIQLNDDDIDVMLQFFHDIREILYFNQKDLKDAIVLDLQWFSNAFKNIITDENHAKVDLMNHIMKWETFNKTGVLDGQLLDAIWNIHPDNYISHKKEIMPYMEKVGLLAAFSNGEEKWYIPSMNKIPFEKQKLLSYPSSSILCFQFDALPVGIFNRLVALCIQVPFEILACENEQCIYQTAAIFKYADHHHFVIGMTKSAIQLQAFVITGNVNITYCHQIQQKVEGILDACSKTFQSNFTFSVGYKCKSSGFCDEEESKIIPEEEFTEFSFTCPVCPLEKKHKIETNSIIKYWKEEILPEDTTDSEDLGNVSLLDKMRTIPRRGMAYPFSKRGLQIDVMTSCIKAEVAKSVGLIYLPGGGGTGFRVGSKYIMTCLHVIKDIIKDDCSIDCGNIKIHFGKVDSRPTHIDQENMFRFEPFFYWHKDFDLAILELKPKVGRSFPPQLTLSRILNLSLDIHLIGHPGGVEMKEDNGVYVYEIQPNNDVDQYIYNLSHWGKSNLPGNIDYYEVLRELPRKILFNTTFAAGGSSGGPGIMIENYKPYVVLMISGGVPDCHYKNVFLVQHEERIEFGYAMEDIYKEMEQSADENVKRIAKEIFTERTT